MKQPAATRARHGVALMLFVTVAVNYLDRSNLSVAATDLARDLRLDPVRLGFVFSGFGWAYAFSQIPAGWMVDRLDLRILYALAAALWSIATLAQGLASDFAMLLGLRLLVGLFEAPAYPISSTLVTRWFPEQERAAAIGFYTSGQYIGLAFLTPLLALAQKHLGWRSVFFFTGGLGLAWSIVWYLLYRDPWQSRTLGARERAHIRDGGGWVEAEPAIARPGRIHLPDLVFVLTQRKLWGIYLGQFALSALPWFFLTWFPTYLVASRHLNLVQAGFFSAWPFLAAFVGVLSGGLFSDFLVRKGATPSVARKAPIVGGMVLSASIVGANFVDDPRWVIAILTVAFFGNGFASITWVLVSLIAPRRLLGLTAGVFNFFGNLSAIFVPLLVGFIVKRSGYAPALALVAALALGGALSYVLLVGRVERIELDDVG